jgi:hypothetical protein
MGTPIGIPPMAVDDVNAGGMAAGKRRGSGAVVWRVRVCAVLGNGEACRVSGGRPMTCLQIAVDESDEL